MKDNQYKNFESDQRKGSPIEKPQEWQIICFASIQKKKKSQTFRISGTLWYFYVPSYWSLLVLLCLYFSFFFSSCYLILILIFVWKFSKNIERNLRQREYGSVCNCMLHTFTAHEKNPEHLVNLREFCRDRKGSGTCYWFYTAKYNIVMKRCILTSCVIILMY